MTDRELMQQALDALITAELDGNCEYGATDALRTALAQTEPAECDRCGEVNPAQIHTCSPPEQEPIAYLCENAVGHKYFRWKKPPSIYKPIALYTAHATPQRIWQGLTDEEMMVAAFQAGFDVHEDYDNEDDPDSLHWWSDDGDQCDDTLHKLRDIIEAKLKDKNNG